MRRLLALLLVFSMLIFSGCTYQDQQVYISSGSGSDNLFRIDTMRCPTKEARVYLANYRNLYGQLMGADLWNAGFDTKRIETELLDAVLDHLATVYVMNVYAAGIEAELGEEELAVIGEAADEYYGSLNETELTYMGVSRDDIYEMYKRYALAEKVYYDLMNTVDEEVSEDEARVMDAYVLYLTDLDKAAELAPEIAASGEEFENYVNTYSEGNKNVISFSRGTYPPEIETVVFSLDKGQISELLTADDGYYFFQCVSVYNEELSEENKANVIAERKKALFDQIIKQQQETYYSTLNEEEWDKLYIPTDEGITTETFFQVLDDHYDYTR